MKLNITIGITPQLARILECEQSSVTQQLTDIQEKLEIIMQRQEEFDTKIAVINVALDGVGTSLGEISQAIADEAQQIADWIAANPQVDTSGLDAIVGRMNTTNDAVAGVNEAISAVFEPAPVDPVDPVDPNA